jgi:hypothetical protein
MGGVGLGWVGYVGNIVEKSNTVNVCGETFITWRSSRVDKRLRGKFDTNLKGGL